MSESVWCGVCPRGPEDQAVPAPQSCGRQRWLPSGGGVCLRQPAGRNGPGALLSDSVVSDSVTPRAALLPSLDSEGWGLLEPQVHDLGRAPSEGPQMGGGLGRTGLREGRGSCSGSAMGQDQCGAWRTGLGHGGPPAAWSSWTGSEGAGQTLTWVAPPRTPGSGSPSPRDACALSV